MRSKIFSKKILGRAVIISVLILIAFGPLFFNARISRVQSYNPKAANELLNEVKNTPLNTDTWFSRWAKSWLPDPETLVLGVAQYAVYYLLFKPASWLMSIGGFVLDQSIALSINSGTFRELINNKSS